MYCDILILFIFDYLVTSNKHVQQKENLLTCAVEEEDKKIVENYVAISQSHIRNLQNLMPRRKEATQS